MTGERARSRLQWLRPPVIVAVLAIAAGCERAPTSSPTALLPGDLQPYTTDSLFAQLTPDGRFVLPPPAQERYPQVTRERAAEIALAWARTFGPYHLGELERRHGRRIDLNALQVGSPAYYATAAYEPVLPDVDPGLRNAFGPSYLLYLVSSDGTPVLTVGVAAFTGARVENGRLQYPMQSGGDVVAQGVSRVEGFSVPVSPEEAARLASLASGARAAKVPELVMPHRDFVPHYARWKVTLDRPVSARLNSGPVISTDDVYVGLRGEVVIPSVAQPDGSDQLDPSTRESFRLVRRTMRPVVFEPVTFDR